ncbi:MAG: cupin domain-containing protein [Nitrospinota bacterium]|nr:cupin domain-containing protein [Nitrospinota bacterium]
MEPKKKVVFFEPGEGEMFRLKGVDIEQLLAREHCSQFSAYRVCMRPHEEKKLSYHQSGEELYYVLSGEGMAFLGGDEYRLKGGCFFRVPPQTLHQFKTADHSLEMLNFHSPPVFANHDTYFPKD